MDHDNIQALPAEEICLRCVHPEYYKSGILADRAFLPTTNDNGRLSVERSLGNSAEESFNRRTSTGKSVEAVFGVSIAEFNGVSVLVTLDPISDPESGEITNQWHCLANFPNTPDYRVTAKLLKILANNRGPLFKKP